MARATLSDRFVLGTVVMLAGVGACDPTLAASGPGAITLVPHRAIYDLTLGQSHGQRAIESVRGRILYDFSGSPCDGYALQFRQVSELDNGEGKVSLSDLRAVTWEDANAKNFRFNSENFVNQEIVDSVDGHAERDADRLAVKLSKPKQETFNLDRNMVFPTEHIRRTIEAAIAGKTILEFPVYDGSETGQKVYNTMTVIGHEIPPGENTPTDAAAGKAELKGLRRWPVTISYFDKNVDEATGEQTPAYSIAFELYENGISRALTLDYGDFTVKGEMTQLDIKDSAPCK
jgi:EipB-like